MPDQKTLPHQAPLFFKNGCPNPTGSFPQRAYPFAFCILTLLSGCAPKVQLTTPEPLKVDISMNVNVYQREIASTSQQTSEEELQAIRRSEERAGEIWALKNDEVVIESQAGYLETHLRSGWDDAYVNKIVTEENRDRKIKYEAEARDTHKPIETVQAMAGKRLREQTYVKRQNKVSSTTVPSTNPTTNQKP